MVTLSRSCRAELEKIKTIIKQLLYFALNQPRMTARKRGGKRRERCQRATINPCTHNWHRTRIAVRTTVDNRLLVWDQHNSRTPCIQPIRHFRAKWVHVGTILSLNIVRSLFDLKGRDGEIGTQHTKKTKKIGYILSLNICWLHVHWTYSLRFALSCSVLFLATRWSREWYMHISSPESLVI